MIASGPGCELGFKRADDVLEIGEVAIVQATTACELPHSLDRIEFGTVRGKEIQSKVMGVLFPPRSVQAGAVITSIVGVLRKKIVQWLVRIPRPDGLSGRKA
jgi:hypothetical protein